MIEYPKKRIFGLIGAPRAGKDTVAKYLQESRNFEALAFADKIKEECGITIADFEMAKVNGDIAKVRKKLWEFSAYIRREDPDYFIRLVMDEAKTVQNSVVITDIRTEDEFNALYKYQSTDIISQVYFIRINEEDINKNGFLEESKLSEEFLHDMSKEGKIKTIWNHMNGVYNFYKNLEFFFFKEDIMDLIGPTDSSDCDEHKQHDIDRRAMVSNYISQFDIREKV